MLTGFYVFTYSFVRIVDLSKCSYFGNVAKVPRNQVWTRSSLAHPSQQTALPREEGQYAPPLPTLVWIDDYEPGLALYRMMFEMAGYRVLTASSGKRGIELVAQNFVDAVVVDYEMPEMNGYEVASALKRMRPELPIVLFSGLLSVPTRVLSVVNASCDKAGSREELQNTIEAVLSENPKSHLQPTSLPLASEQAQRTVA